MTASKAPNTAAIWSRDVLPPVPSDGADIRRGGRSASFPWGVSEVEEREMELGSDGPSEQVLESNKVPEQELGSSVVPEPGLESSKVLGPEL